MKLSPTLSVRVVKTTGPRIGLKTWHNVTGLLFVGLCYCRGGGADHELAGGLSPKKKQSTAGLEQLLAGGS